MSINPAWTAGASSKEPLVGDGWFEFSVPRGSVGVSVGLNDQDLSTQPDEPFLYFEFRSGEYRIAYAGDARTSWATHPAGAKFALVRHGAEFHCCVGTGAPLVQAGVPFPMPPTVVHTVAASSLLTADRKPDLAGPLLLDAALLYSGDQVVGAALVEVGNGARVNFVPGQVTASQAFTGTAKADLLPMVLRADNGSGADISFESMTLASASNTFAEAHLVMQPMTALAMYGQSPLRGVSASFEFLRVTSSGPADVSARTNFLPLDARASQTEYNSAEVEFPGMYADARLGGHPSAKLRGQLPSFGGALPIGLAVTDGVLASDQLRVGHLILAEDDVSFGGEFKIGRTSVVNLEGKGYRVGDGVRLGGIVDVEDSLVMFEDWAHTDVAIFIEDGYFVSSQAKYASNSTLDLESEAIVWDSVSVRSAVMVTDGLVVSDGVRTGGGLQVEDVFVTSEVWAPGSNSVLDVVDTIWASEATTVRGTSVVLVQDTAVFSDRLMMKQPGLVAWVMNTDTGAVSWYDNWAFTSMATVGGKVFAAGPGGLHLVGGDLDAGDQIDARVDFGYTEFGGYDDSAMPKPSDQRKRVAAFWFGYHATGELSASIETYGQGYGAFTYSMPPRSAAQPRNSRIVPGRGLSARYWRMSVANTNGCAFETHSISAEVAESSRRI